MLCCQVFVRFSFLKQVQKNPSVFKEPNPLGFGGFIGFWALLGFSDFLFERVVG